jgi:NADPH-dependent ferric siderophore reductase
MADPSSAPDADPTPLAPLEARRRPVPDTLFGGRLRGAHLLDLEVIEVRDDAPPLRTLRFRSPDLVGFAWEPGQDIMFDVPGHTDVRRRYTIRRADGAAGTLDIDIVLHGDGPFARWAAGVAVGDHIDGIGPRGAITLRADAAHHLFVGDESAVPVTFAMLEALPEGATATAVLAASLAGAVVAPDGPHIDLRWTTSADLGSVLAGVALPPATAAYVNGERTLVREVAAALAARGVATDRTSTKPYWRRDQANAAHGEPPKE